MSNKRRAAPRATSLRIRAFIAWCARGCSGQSTVEFVVVGVGLMAVILGLAALGNRLEEGLFVQHAADSASHAFTRNGAGSAGDILIY